MRTICEMGYSKSRPGSPMVGWKRGVEPFCRVRLASFAAQPLCSESYRIMQNHAEPCRLQNHAEPCRTMQNDTEPCRITQTFNYDAKSYEKSGRITENQPFRPVLKHLEPSSFVPHKNEPQQVVFLKPFDNQYVSGLSIIA